MTERRSDRVRAPVSLPGIAALEAVVEGSVVPRDSPDFEVLRKPAWAQFEDIAPQVVVLCMTAGDANVQCSEVPPFAGHGALACASVAE